MPDKVIEQLTAIRDKMKDLRESEDLSYQNIFVGLLLTIQWLASRQMPEIKRLASQIHGYAQDAWREVTARRR